MELSYIDSLFAEYKVTGSGEGKEGEDKSGVRCWTESVGLSRTVLC